MEMAFYDRRIEQGAEEGIEPRDGILCGKPGHNGYMVREGPFSRESQAVPHSRMGKKIPRRCIRRKGPERCTHQTRICHR